jgi:ribosomal protein S4
LKVGDEVAVKPSSQKISRFQLASDLFTKRPVLPWIDVDHSKMVGKVIANPQRADVQLSVKERLVVELYSK